MPLRPPTEAELRHTFNEVLDGILSGQLTGCPTDTGLDHRTEDILNLLARQPGRKRPSDIAACLIEFERMLDGTHAREDAAADDTEWAELLAEDPVDGTNAPDSHRQETDAIVDEYGGETLSGTTERESEQPTLGELEEFFMGAWPLLRVFEMNFEADREKMLDLFQAVSQFYPDPDRLLRQRVIEALSEPDDDEETNPDRGLAR